MATIKIRDAVRIRLRDELPKPTHENKVPWLYRDSLGHLTIGVGHLVIRDDQLTAEEDLRDPLAELLNYEHRFLGSNVDATVEYGTFCKARAKVPSALGPLEAQSRIASFLERIPEDGKWINLPPGPWGLATETIAAQTNPDLALLMAEAWRIMRNEWQIGRYAGSKGLPHEGSDAASYYRCHSSFTLTEKGMTDLLDADIDRRACGLLADYVNQTEFDAWPEAAQAAVLDLVFNFGGRGLFDRAGNKKLADAIRARKWADAASVLDGYTLNPRRQKDRAALFRLAAEPAKKP